jgi:hypothetical protein
MNSSCAVGSRHFMHGCCEGCNHSCKIASSTLTCLLYRQKRIYFGVATCRRGGGGHTVCMHHMNLVHALSAQQPTT